MPALVQPIGTSLRRYVCYSNGIAEAGGISGIVKITSFKGAAVQIHTLICFFLWIFLLRQKREPTKTKILLSEASTRRNKATFLFLIGYLCLVESAGSGINFVVFFCSLFSSSLLFLDSTRGAKCLENIVWFAASNDFIRYDAKVCWNVARNCRAN